MMDTFKSRLLHQLIVCGFLAGCARTGAQPVPSVIEPVIESTASPSPVSGISPSSTLQYMESILTAAAIVQQTRTAPYIDPCIPPSYEYPSVVDIPETDVYYWLDYPSSVGELRQLAGLTTPIMGIDPSPSGHWAVVSLLYQELGYGDYNVFLFMLDTAGNQHWFIGEDEGNENTYRWLPDNRIIWADDGELFIANEDGSNHHGLQAPSPVYEVWVGANNIALVSGDRDLWRFFINTETWEKVENIEGVSFPGANLKLSMDGTFAAVNISGDISIIPLQAGNPARLLLDAEPYGKDGRAGAPDPIPNSPYWRLPGIEIPKNEDWWKLLFDTRDGSLHSFDEFFPEGAYGLYYSPDGNWVYTRIGGRGKKIEDAYIVDLYAAPTTDFTAGSIVFTGIYELVEVIGWETSPPAMVISPYPDSPEVIRVSLDDFESEAISASPEFESWQNGVKFLVSEQAIDKTITFRVEAFSQENEALGSIDLPPNTKEVGLYPIGNSKVIVQTRELMNQVGDICYHDYRIWQWNIAP